MNDETGRRDEENGGKYDLESSGDAKLQPAVEEKSSFIHAVLNMIGMLIGLGQLSTPYALENGGWTSVFLLVGLGAVCTYTSHLLGKCLSKHSKSRDYKDIGQNAFGSRGKITAATFVYMEIFMSLISYTISLHDNLAVVFRGARLWLDWLPSWAHLSSSQMLATVAVLVALPSLWLRNLSSISFLSTAGILMSILIFVTVACTAIFGAVKADHRIPVLNLRAIPAISGLYMFGYAGHIVFPNLYAAMKDPAKFTKVSIISFSIVTSWYAALAFTGAKLFGPEVDSQITLSMPQNLLLTKIALWATVLTPMTKYALEFAPLAIELERSLPRSLKTRTKILIRGTIGSILLLVILALALSVPYFEHVLSLTGSMVSVGISIVIPCIFYIKIYWTEISTPVLALNAIIATTGMVMGAFGTVTSARSLLNSFKTTHTKH